MTVSDADPGSLRRGQIYWIEWEPGRGSEQRGRRPALVVQCDPFNRSQRYSNTIVVALSTAAHDVPVHVRVEPTSANGLRQTSYVLCEQLLTISRERLGGLIGDLDPGSMREVDRGLKRILALY